MTPRDPSDQRTTSPPSATLRRRNGTGRRRPLGVLAALGPAVLALAIAVPAHPGAASSPVRAAPVAAAPAARVATAASDVAAHPHGAAGDHVVAPGETLSGIAAATGTTVSALVAANGLGDPNLVMAGTRLSVPGGGGASRTSPESPSSVPSSSAGLPARLRQSPDRLAYRPTFARWAAANDVPVDLLEAMTWLESGWQNGLVSPDGAMGIGQLMPGTVDHMEMLIGVDLDPDVVDDNIRMAARYLRWLLSRYGGDPADALAAYYQGHASVARNGRFSDTQTYVDNILALRSRF